MKRGAGIRRSAPLVVTVLAALLGGCATGAGVLTDLGLSGSDYADIGSSEVQAVWRKEAPMTVSGTIGVVAIQPSQCHLLRMADGDPFALVGRLPGVAEGEAVRVSGTLAAWSTCDTYRTLRIERIDRIPPGAS